MDDSLLRAVVLAALDAAPSLEVVAVTGSEADAIATLAEQRLDIVLVDGDGDRLPSVVHRVEALAAASTAKVVCFVSSGDVRRIGALLQAGASTRWTTDGSRSPSPSTSTMSSRCSASVAIASASEPVTATTSRDGAASSAASTTARSSESSISTSRRSVRRPRRAIAPWGARPAGSRSPCLSGGLSGAGCGFRRRFTAFLSFRTCDLLGRLREVLSGNWTFGGSSLAQEGSAPLAQVDGAPAAGRTATRLAGRFAVTNLT